MKERQYWQTPKAGNIARLALNSDDAGPLPADKVRIAVHAVGLNFADIFALTGLYSATPQGAFTPGLEFSGVVLECGKDCSQWQPGDRVMGVTRFGGYSTLIDSDPAYLWPLPESWDFASGAAYPVQTLTAWYALKTLGNLQPQQRVLIHSAAGGVGLQAMQLTRALGGLPVGTVGRADKVALLRSKGFDKVLVREKDFAQQLKCENQQFDLVLDGIGGAVQKASFDALNPMGRLVVFGAAEFTPTGQRPDYLRALLRYLRRPRYDVMDMISANKSVMAFNLIWLWEQSDRMRALMDELDGLRLPAPHVGHQYSFEEAHQALAKLQSGSTTGKVVLCCE